MKKYIITGAGGFVAQYLIKQLEVCSDAIEILGIDLFQPKNSYTQRFYNLNLLSYTELEQVITTFIPDVIVHLAAFSSVGKSWEQPAECFVNNTNIFLNILEVVRRNGLKSRILSVGSSEEYGIVDESDLPLSESHSLNPISPYAVARVAQEQLSLVYAKSYGLDIVITRSFNHVGVGQNPIFVVPSLINQFANHYNEIPLALKVGDVSIVRDFMDVEDVVRAYQLLIEKGKSGEVYNVCSGIGISIEELIIMIGEIGGKKFVLSKDLSLIRPSDNKALIGDNSKLRDSIGWVQRLSLKESIQRIYANIMQKVGT